MGRRDVPHSTPGAVQRRIAQRPRNSTETSFTEVPRRQFSACGSRLPCVRCRCDSTEVGVQQPQWSFHTFASVGEHQPVDLYHSEKERRADAEQQRAVHRFQGAYHLPPGWQR
jgi:hypothetical protein